MLSTPGTGLGRFVRLGGPAQGLLGFSAPLPPMRGRAAMAMQQRLMLVFVVAATVFSMGHATRKSFVELAVPTCVHSVRRPGGVSEFRYSRISLNVYERERQSNECMLEEGYDHKFAFRGKSSVWTYNCQMADVSRMRAWGPEFKGEYVALQGTQGTYRPEFGERALQQWSSDTHDIVESEFRRRGRGTHLKGLLSGHPRACSV